MEVGITRVRVRGFRSARDVEFSPGNLCALVGEASVGKSNLLEAIRAVLDPGAPRIGPEEAALGGDGTIRIELALEGQSPLTLEVGPDRPDRIERGSPPPVLFLPAALRAEVLVAPSAPRTDAAEPALTIFQRALSEQVGGPVTARSAAAPALSLVSAVELCCSLGLTGLVLLVEEPELFLRPQAQRYLYRSLRTLASAGNQIIYSTHAPAFLNVGRLEELVIVEHDAMAGTKVFQPKPLPTEEEFRVVSEFDAERSELFLARAAVLVEGRTEKLVFPFVFQALGHDADREAVSVIECGGKSNIPLFARICQATEVPFVVVHDRDAMPGEEPIQAELVLNELIAEVAGVERTFVLEPDFEGVAGIRGHKPEGAWRHFRSLAATEVPEPLARAAELALTLARRTRGAEESARADG